jgi:hypothetical protein
MFVRITDLKEGSVNHDLIKKPHSSVLSPYIYEFVLIGFESHHGHACGFHISQPNKGNYSATFS